MIYLERRRNYQKYVVPKKLFTEKVDWRRRAGRDKEWRLDGQTTSDPHTVWRHIHWRSMWWVFFSDIANVASLKFLIEQLWTLSPLFLAQLHSLTSRTQQWICWHFYQLVKVITLWIEIYMFTVVNLCIYKYIYVKSRLGDKLPDHFYYWRATSGGRWKRWAKLVISAGWRRVQSSNQAGISAHSPIHTLG